MTTALPDDLKKYLDESNAFATVATLMPDGRPHQTVVWVIRDGDDLLFSTTADRRQARNMARDPRVAVVINPPETPYIYTEVQGTVTLTPDTGHTLLDTIARKYTGKSYAEFNAEAARTDGERIAVRVTPDKVTGRR
ncbi:MULTISPECIES: PPOX class F420-dependent oxidoreductase [Streptomyces]|uniref:PPOX class F420-dependent oxidoreductase n=1 Tax=unclassified Streptomyces TaxID=2593676 RepID=UPI0004BD147F|nr:MULTISPECIES: PPOX class F420-dependent oxidoreductase [unclassified Streptomyces]KPC68860.1 pyridoxamine 5'-phosphate oxidase [Streptomyces sp. NRRL F-6602]